MIGNYTTTRCYETEDTTNALIRYFSPPLGEQNLQKILSKIEQYSMSLGFHGGVILDITSETLFVLFNRGIESSKKQMFIGGVPTNHFYCLLYGIVTKVVDHYIREHYVEIRKREGRINYLRKNHDGGTNYGEDPFMALVHTEQKEGLEQAIDELPKNQRIVTRIYLEEGNNIDTAKRLNKTLASTRMVLIRSRRNMQKIFRNKGLTKSYFFEGK